MLIIGELLNSTRKEVKQALQNQDDAVIRKLAREQVAAGADVLDVNTATSRKLEIEHMEWVIGLIHEEVGTTIRLVIDSPNPVALSHGLKYTKAQPIINSINNKEDSLESVLPLIEEYDAEVIGLTMGARGMPKTAEDRLTEAEQLIHTLREKGFDLKKLYIDPLVMTVGSNQEQAGYVINTVRSIKERWGDTGVKTSVGLSNVSHGLPKRTLLNRAFLAMLLEAGVDAALIDPLDRGMIDMVRASETILGIDASCLQYIKYMRERG